jgi:hypothetical protein
VVEYLLEEGRKNLAGTQPNEKFFFFASSQTTESQLHPVTRPSPAMDLNHSEQARLEQIMVQNQAKEMMKMFFKVSADCFDACVSDFSSKALSPREVTSQRPPSFFTSPMLTPILIGRMH